MNDRTATQIEKVFPLTAIASTPSLPVAKVSQAMFHGDTLAQLGSSHRCQLALTQFPQQCLIRMNVDTAPVGTAGAPLAQGAGRTDLCRELHCSAGFKRHLLLVGAADALLLPVQLKGRLGKAR